MVACDLTDRDAVHALVGGITATTRLAGVVHTAGVLDDGVVTALTAERLTGVLKPKVDAAWHLHEATAGTDLDLFVLVSLTAGVFGAPGQASYAAGNAFLDALAEHRRATGLPALLLPWGLWDTENAGMSGSVAARDRARINRAGFAAITPDVGTALLDAALAAGPATLVPVVLATCPLCSWWPPPPGCRTCFARSSVRSPPAGRRRTRPPTAAGRPGPAAMAPDDAHAEIALLVRGLVAQVLGHGSADAVPADRAFRELGFDSLTAVDLRNRINQATGLRLASTLVFDYPTPGGTGRRRGPAGVR